jgi:copper chaperone CopZ
MTTIELSTDLHCENCVERIGRKLSGAQGISSWKADLADPQKKVTVTSELARMP